MVLSPHFSICFCATGFLFLIIFGISHWAFWVWCLLQSALKTICRERSFLLIWADGVLISGDRQPAALTDGTQEDVTHKAPFRRRPGTSPSRLPEVHSGIFNNRFKTLFVLTGLFLKLYFSAFCSTQYDWAMLHRNHWRKHWQRSREVEGEEENWAVSTSFPLFYLSSISLPSSDKNSFCLRRFRCFATAKRVLWFCQFRSHALLRMGSGKRDIHANKILSFNGFALTVCSTAHHYKHLH